MSDEREMEGNGSSSDLVSAPELPSGYTKPYVFAGFQVELHTGVRFERTT